MPGIRSFRFAARPKWIFGHVLALVAVVGFINLGFWQLRRHDERSAVNATIAGRTSATATPLSDLIEKYGEDPGSLEYRKVSVTGRYLVDDEVLWQARTLGGRSGHDVLTPLLVDRRAVIVDRGWVPIDASGPPVVEAGPPPGDVTVTGTIRPSRQRSGLGPIDPEEGVLDRISRVDVERLQLQMETELYPFYVLLEGQAPAQLVDLPLLQAQPSVDSGPHVGYAVQWFIFATIAAIGYPVLLSRTARDASGT